VASFFGVVVDVSSVGVSSAGLSLSSVMAYLLK
jgi:hypothetical protein